MILRGSGKKVNDHIYMDPDKLLNQKDRCIYLQFAYLGDCEICKEPVYGTPPKDNWDRFNYHRVVHSECYRKKTRSKDEGGRE